MTLAADTIAAIASAAGPAGVGVVRVSGSSSEALLRALFKAPPDSPIESHRMMYGQIAGDAGYAVLFRAPYTFTGEDVAEFHVHGGALNLRSVLRAAIAAGARPARPGEFSERAFWNGKIDLARAEAIADIVAAEGEAALEYSRAASGGALSQRVATLRDELLGVRAALEVALDHADDTATTFDRAKAARDLGETLDATNRLVETHRVGRIAREGLRVAIVGRPNVGKSSLFNALVGDDRALVDDAAGTTRDFIEDAIDVAGVRVTLVDTAGIREKAGSVEARGIAHTRRAIASADAVVWVLDGSLAWTADDTLVGELLGGRRAIAVINKADCPLRLDVRAPLAHAIPVSAHTRLGLDAIGDALAQLIQVEPRPSDHGAPRVVITRERHRDALSRAATAIARAREGLAGTLPEECAATDIQDALGALGEITGETAHDELVNRIFRDFCVGK
ncbi:MAG: tRNA uridine-5-carboxymethylaminomethyl(34) synthesis GTPase MnmE [Deltaproteobacteria bacterium]|nr:tRNA uridine-5-carboxymethylaminomethyl(34) synthesis GTPase MnmE [Deltaproteobacteria bacterium]